MSSKKRVNGANKGSTFEREFCTRLSEWLTCGVADDTFWRSQASGARHTNRAKQGRTTTGQAGDIAATDPAFAFVTENIVWELKRGYPSLDLHRVMEAPKVINELEQFIHKLLLTAHLAEATYWIFVSRRNQGSATVWMPMTFVNALREADPWAMYTLNCPSVVLTIPDRGSRIGFQMIGVSDNDFFELDSAAFLSAARP